MAETLQQKRSRHQRERLEALECIARIKAILAIGGCGQTEESLAMPKLTDIRAIIADYNRKVV